jgi:hypothetical protein
MATTTTTIQAQTYQIEGEVWTAAEIAELLGISIVEHREYRDLSRVMVERDEHLFPETESGRAAYVPGLGLRPIRRTEIDLGAVHELASEDALDGLRDLDPGLADRITRAIEDHLDADRDRDQYDYWREEADLHYRRTRGV